MFRFTNYKITSKRMSGNEKHDCIKINGSTVNTMNDVFE